jgi:hypothetical protein
LAGYETVDEESVPLSLHHLDLLTRKTLAGKLEIDDGNAPVIDQG